MSTSPGSGAAQAGLARALTRLSARTPLRIKLMTALLALVIGAVAGISIAGAFVFRDYVHASADKQVISLLHNADQSLSLGGARGDQPIANCFWPLVEAFVPTGQQLSHCQMATGSIPLPAVPSSSAWLQANNGKLVTMPATFGGGTWRVITWQRSYRTFGSSVSGTLIAAEDLSTVNEAVARLVSIDLIVGAIVVLGLAILGVAVVRTSLQPLAEIEQTAGEIATGDLTRRVTERDPRTEVGSLGRSLNAMLAQIEAAFQAKAKSEANARSSEARMRQFAADASHELRTPLTAIKGYAEYYRQRGGVTPDGHGELTSEDLDRIMRRVEDEATRMGMLVEDLLLLARIDQQRPLDLRPVDMLALAADAVQDARAMAPDREVRLTVGHDTAFLVIGDEAKLRQVVGNLMNNALTHTPDGSPIEVQVRSGVLDSWTPSAGPGRAGPGTASPAAGWGGAYGPAASAAGAGPTGPAAGAGLTGPASGRGSTGRPVRIARPVPPAPAAPAAGSGPARSAGTEAGSSPVSQLVPAVVLEVVDHGPGLSREQAERVFERFYRADQARTRETGGTGLGLAIVSALVVAHGGRVSVDTAPGHGATFRVVLPLDPEAQGADWDEPEEQEQDHDWDEQDGFNGPDGPDLLEL
jgi:two-component system, OmpR family, sensor kinase